ncbi:chemotaxis protein CheY [Mesorhizobium sp. L103C131B0]|nr:GAF domain-containing protein [Mesorhizobium sp. L103C131B0]ESZ60832.1 chemotaxis protein CheY [Mesorhizobium sp. L103C131B0]
MQITTRLLGEHLGVSICAYADMEQDQDHFTIRGDWSAPGSPSIRGYYSLADFGRLAVTNLSANKPLIINNNLEEIAPEEAKTFQDIGITATICMPLVKQGRLTALMAIHDKQRRVWSQRELSLLTEVTERSWAHIERVRSEQAARASEERLRLATDAAAIGTWDYDPISGVLRWDDRCKALFGLPPDAEVTYESAFLAGLHPEDRARADEAVRQSLAPGTPSRYDIEYRTIGLRDGKERWIAATGEALFQSGRAIRFIGTVVDVTARKRVEHQLQLMNATAAAVAAELDVERIVQTVTDAGVVLSGAQFGAFFYNVIDDKGDSYVLYALSGAPRSAFENFPMPRNTAVFEPTFRGTSVVRSDDILTDPRYGKNWPRKGMPEGHLPVRSYLAVPVVSRSGEVLGGLFLGHSETGVFAEQQEAALLGLAGHAATAIDNSRLFKALQTLNGTLEQRVKDEVAEVYGFVRQSGGSVKIYSERGVGTTLKIYLPRSHHGVLDSQIEVVAGEHPGCADEIIMVVEDEDRVRLTAAEALRELGYSVLEMQGPREALVAVERGQVPSLLFTDVVMPEMSGRELVDQVKTMHPSLKVLYTTGYTRNAIVHNGTLDFGTELLTKPYTIDELAEKVRKVLDRK